MKKDGIPYQNGVKQIKGGKIVKTIVHIYFEQPMDKESEEIHKSLSNEQIQEFLTMWKEEAEKIIRSEFATNIENFKAEFEIV
jgi:hypothetical protein